MDGGASSLVMASLVSKYLEPPLNADDECRIRFYLHFTKDPSLQDMKFLLGLRYLLVKLRFFKNGELY